MLFYWLTKCIVNPQLSQISKTLISNSLWPLEGNIKCNRMEKKKPQSHRNTQGRQLSLVVMEISRCQNTAWQRWNVYLLLFPHGCLQHMDASVLQGYVTMTTRSSEVFLNTQIPDPFLGIRPQRSFCAPGSVDKTPDNPWLSQAMWGWFSTALMATPINFAGLNPQGSLIGWTGSPHFIDWEPEAWSTFLNHSGLSGGKTFTLCYVLLPLTCLEEFFAEWKYGTYLYTNQFSYPKLIGLINTEEREKTIGPCRQNRWSAWLGHG